MTWFAERYDTTSNEKLGGFRTQLQASYVSSHTEELWYNETVCLWVTIYIYIYIVIHWQTVPLYHNISMSLDVQDASSRDRNPPNFTSAWWHISKPVFWINDSSKFWHIRINFRWFTFMLSATEVLNLLGFFLFFFFATQVTSINSFTKDERTYCWLVVWVLWHINLCRSFNAKFCLYIHTYSTKDFKRDITVGRIFYLEDMICLHKINQFKVVIFLVQLCLSQEEQNVIYIYCNPQTDCFFSVARRARRFWPRSKQA